jgi:hypothetical protein
MPLTTKNSQSYGLSLSNASNAAAANVSTVPIAGYLNNLSVFVARVLGKRSL